VGLIRLLHESAKRLAWQHPEGDPEHRNTDEMKLRETGNGYPVTEVILSDNAQEGYPSYSLGKG